MALTKQQRRKRIKNRIRSKIHGTAEVPRMSIFRSNKQIYAQLIDDNSGKTLLAVGSTEKNLTANDKVTKAEQAKKVGKAVAKKALEKGRSVPGTCFSQNLEKRSCVPTKQNRKRKYNSEENPVGTNKERDVTVIIRD